MRTAPFLHWMTQKSIEYYLPYFLVGAQWLSGRVLDSRPRGRGFEPHRRHCDVTLSMNIYPSLVLVLVQPRKIRRFITERLLMGRKESNQTQKNSPIFRLITNSGRYSFQILLCQVDVLKFYKVTKMFFNI